MIVQFWGVRGTTPSPGPDTLRYGGNTSCVSVEIGTRVLILDAGTGIRTLGRSLAGKERDIFILLTHLHLDHIQGFPLFEPIYEPGHTVHLLDYAGDGAPWTLLNLLDGVHFPLSSEDLPGTYRRVKGNVLTYLRDHGIHIRALPLNHPGGAFGYRIEHGQRTFIYMPDNELKAERPTTAFDQFVAFCKGADVLCHDAQYDEAEMTVKHGWGHSTARQACDLAIAAGVRHLVLFHHDPDRSDDALDELQAAVGRYVTPHNLTCTVAYEGLRLNLSEEQGVTRTLRVRTERG